MHEDKEFETFLESIRQIQMDTMALNEDDEEKSDDPSKNDESNKDNKSSSGDIDALLKDSDSNENDDSSSKDNELDNIPDLNTDDLSSDDNSKNKDNDLGDFNLDKDSTGEDETTDNEDSSSSKNFETDGEGLADTITKLAKTGHKVTITVTNEGKFNYFYKNKRVTPKQIRTLAEIILPKTSKSSYNDKTMRSLMEQIDSLKREIKGIKSGKPVQEIKYIKISQDNYDRLNEMVEDMRFKIDEQEMIINNYKESLAIHESDENMLKMMDDFGKALDESSDYINNNNSYYQSQYSQYNYNKGTDNALSIVQEDVMPVLTDLSSHKTSLINELYNINADIEYQELQEAINGLDKDINYLNKLNKMSKIESLVESKLNDNTKYSKSDIMSIISEANSDIMISNDELGYDSTNSKIPSFEDRVRDTLNKAARGLTIGSNGSQIMANIDDNTGNLLSKSGATKFDIPIARPNFSEGATVKSAIMNLNEALIDLDGNLNIPLCEQAFLYKKVKNPTSLKDFAFPIAMSENNRLVLVPQLVKTTANILKNDSCIKTYGIDSRNTFYSLRESIEPLLNRLDLDIPWKEESLLDEAKKKVSGKKCKECGAVCKDGECEDGLCPTCKKAKKKASKKKSK